MQIHVSKKVVVFTKNKSEMDDRCDTSSHLRITVPSFSLNSKKNLLQMIVSSLSRAENSALAAFCKDILIKCSTA